MDSLKNIRKGLKLTQSEMALSLGIEQPTYNIYENNKKTFPEHLIEKLKEIYNIDYNPTEPIKEYKGVPVYDIDFTAGNVTKFEEFQERIIGHVDLNGFRKCVAFVKVKGNSMFPTFTGGDIVGLEPMEDISIIEYGQPFGVVTKSGQNMIKFIRKGSDEDNIILRSSSKDHDDIPIHKDQILKLFKAHGPIRNTFY
jgi:transcriptional regulator with XRE-family HTH domain